MLKDIRDTDFGALPLGASSSGVCHYVRRAPPRFTGDQDPFFVADAHTKNYLGHLFRIPVEAFLHACSQSTEGLNLQDMAASSNPLARAAVDRALAGPIAPSFIPQITFDYRRGYDWHDPLRSYVYLAKALHAAGTRYLVIEVKGKIEGGDAPEEGHDGGDVDPHGENVLGSDQKNAASKLAQMKARIVRGDTPYENFYASSLLRNFALGRDFSTLIGMCRAESQALRIHADMPVRLAKAYLWLIDRQFQAQDDRKHLWNRWQLPLPENDGVISSQLAFRANALLEWLGGIARKSAVWIDPDEAPAWQAASQSPSHKIDGVRQRLRTFITSNGIIRGNRKDTLDGKPVITGTFSLLPIMLSPALEAKLAATAATARRESSKPSGAKPYGRDKTKKAVIQWSKPSGNGSLAHALSSSQPTEPTLTGSPMRESSGSVANVEIPSHPLGILGQIQHPHWEDNFRLVIGEALENPSLRQRALSVLRAVAESSTTVGASAITNRQAIAVTTIMAWEREALSPGAPSQLPTRLRPFGIIL